MNHLDPMRGVETLVEDAVSIARDLTKQAVSSILDNLILKPVKAVSLGILKAIFSIPSIPLRVRNEP